MKIRIAVVLIAAAVIAAVVIEWKLAVSMGRAYAKHEYHGICNGGVGEPYRNFIHELRAMAEGGDTNRLMMVLRRADENSRDIYDVWLFDEYDAFRESLQKKILK